jgi:uncharacterized protein YecE (DUF72 family)
MTVLVGTASWADKSLVDSGKFYPPDVTSPEARLRYYASQFPLVEVDSSYYAIPLPLTAQQWAERTPEDFTFNVKAFRLFTGHQAQPRVLPKDIQEALGEPLNKNVYYRDLPPEIQQEIWGRFFQALEPLHASGKLGAVHFQFAPWITSGGEARQLVEHCVQVMGDTLMAVEFRNASWWNERNRESTLAFEREHGLVNVVVDGPRGVGNAVPPVWEVTSPDLAIVRMHGRNHATWSQKGLKAASDRFNYDYSEKELAEIAARVADLSQAVPLVHAVMNNNYEDQGQRNAKTLTTLLAASPIVGNTAASA